MFGEDSSEIPAVHPKQDHVVHFDLVHDHIIRFGNKARSSITGNWEQAVIKELDGIAAVVTVTGGKRLISVTAPDTVYGRDIAYMDEEGKVLYGDYDFMAETLLDASYAFGAKIEVDQALIAKLDI